MEKKTTREKVLEIYPNAKCHDFLRSGDARYCVMDFSQNVFEMNLGSSYTSREAAWRHAWVKIQRKMLEKLENL